jgi:uncharacterized protein YifE (UPF0438 family)
MTEKEKHKAFIKSKGTFRIDCNTDAFNTDEIHILEKWSNWFEALCTEKLKPFNMMQEHFIRVAKGEIEPFSLEEKAWGKYLAQRDEEIKPGDPRNKINLPHVNPFYTDEMYKKQKRIMSSETWKNHRI